MSGRALVDTHLHLWDPRRLNYSWQAGNAFLNRPYLIENYQSATADTNVVAMVFVECLVDAGDFLAEVRFVEEQAAIDSRIKAIVAQASLEQGYQVLPFLETLKASTPLLRGIRRIIEFESDPHFCLRPDFIEGVRLLKQLGLSFEINVNYRQLDAVLRFLDRVPDVRMILDHGGKPGIREGHLEPWRTQIRELAKNPNLFFKLSDFPVEADHENWTEAQIRPFIDAAVEAFGFDRLMYGSDWPVCLQAITIPKWVSLLDRAFAGVGAADLDRFYQNNAVEFYRLRV